MAVDDVYVREFVVWRIFPLAAVAGTLWYCRYRRITGKAIRRRIASYLMVKFLDRFSKEQQIVKTKQQLFSKLQDQKTNVRRKLQILEIGTGGGVNFRYYPSGSQIICLDPNKYFEDYIKEKVELSGVEMKCFIKGFAEDMYKVDDSTVDAVVCSLVLCSVKDVDKSLSEIIRVLKPNGTFYFVEHVAAEKGTFLYRLQRLINPLWYFFTGDCQINRDTATHLKQAGFSEVSLDKFSLQTKIILIRPFLYGTATK